MTFFGKICEVRIHLPTPFSETKIRKIKTLKIVNVNDKHCQLDTSRQHCLDGDSPAALVQLTSPRPNRSMASTSVEWTTKRRRIDCFDGGGIECIQISHTILTANRRQTDGKHVNSRGTQGEYSACPRCRVTKNHCRSIGSIGPFFPIAPNVHKPLEDSMNSPV